MSEKITPPAPAGNDLHALDYLLQILVQQDGSDLHLSVGNPPVFRIGGVMRRMESAPLTNEQVVFLLGRCLKREQGDRLLEEKDADFAYRVEGLGRFRVNIFRTLRGMSAVFRVIPTVIPTIEALGLPPVVKRLALEPRGLILVTGATGSGKSTTLAAIINHINHTRPCHIVTLEDPIEFMHESQEALINQREILDHVTSFERGLRAALREDPDVILVGEMRDLETIEYACRAAETGHLVFATLHANSAAKTIDRIIEVFPDGKQQQIRLQLSDTLKAVIAQQLIPRRGGKGRVAAHEIMINTPAIATMIRERKVHQIHQVIGSNSKSGMQTMDQALVDLVIKQKIDANSAIEKAHIPSEVVTKLRQRNMLAGPVYGADA